MQILFNGIISGLTIALTALAFQVVYLPTRVFFFALAGLYAIGPYIFLASQKIGFTWFICGIVSFVSVVSLAMIFEWLNHANLSRKNASEGAHFISSLGIFIVLVQIITILWGNDTQTLGSGIDSTVRVASVVLTQVQIFIVFVSLLLLFTFLLMLRYTSIGLKLRALADNPTQFALYGYNVNTHRLFAFGLAGVFVYAASMLTAYDIGFDPYAGFHALLLSVVSVFVGGRSSFFGPIVGGLLLGVIRVLVVWFLSARWQEAITFAVLALVLLCRPQGLWGRQVRLEEMAG